MGLHKRKKSVSSEKKIICQLQKRTYNMVRGKLLIALNIKEELHNDFSKKL